MDILLAFLTGAGLALLCVGAAVFGIALTIID